jgi:hypothetical protein
MATLTSPAAALRHSATANAERLLNRHRRWLVYLTFTIYWLLILEGGLRKWVLPGYGRYLYFIRDPFVLVLYLLALKAQIWPRRTFFLTFGVLFSIASLVLIVIQARLSEIPFSWLLAGIGWRMYFFYFPLPFLIAKFFRREDFTRLVRQTLLFAIPMALLVYAQYRSPAGAEINGGIAKTGEDQYGSGSFSSGRAVRTTGTFTSPVGQEYFSCSLVAMLVGTWLVRPSRRPIRGLPLVLATASGLICVLLSGSRSTLMLTFIILLITGVSLLFIGREALFFRSIASLVLLGPACFGAITLFAPDAIDNIQSHWELANVAEQQGFGQFGVLSRVLFDLYGFTYLIPQTPLIGFGMGLATNAAPALTNSAEKMHGASQYFAVWLPTTEQRFGAETGLGRHIIDLGPIFGLLYIGFRIAFAIWIGARAVRAARRTGDITPVAIFSFVAYALSVDFLTGNGTVYGYGWLFAGLALAISNFTVSTPTLYRPLVRVFPRRQPRLLVSSQPVTVPNLQG